jgi:polyhydroxyalkanoate synthesis repressor PhaR
MSHTETAERAKTGQPVVIKKYANRRLYNTASSAYVTLDNLAQMVREGQDFVVYDAKTNEDITRSVLTQIILEEESRGESLLPLQFLRQLIRFYGDSMQAVLPSYLELSLDSFAKQHERTRHSAAALAGSEAMELYQAQVRQNLALFERALKMFSPFQAAGAASTAPEPPPAPPPPTPASGDALAEMRAQLASMQAKLEELAAKR